MVKDLTKKRMTGMKPASAKEAFEATKKVALKKIERDFADDNIRANFEKFKDDATKLLEEFSPEELALYVLSLTVQDPETMPKVEIANEKPLPFKYVGHGHNGKNGKGRRQGGGRRNRDGERRRDNDRRDRDGGKRDFKRKSNKNRKDFENKDNKRPHRTSSEKQNGFVIRNKGER